MTKRKKIISNLLGKSWEMFWRKLNRRGEESRCVMVDYINKQDCECLGFIRLQDGTLYRQSVLEKYKSKGWLSLGIPDILRMIV